MTIPPRPPAAPPSPVSPPVLPRLPAPVRSPLALLLLLLSLLLATALPAPAATVTPADLGPAARDGIKARDGIAARAARLHIAMACGNELEFARGFALAVRHGKEKIEGAEWPVTLLLGKTMRLYAQGDSDGTCRTELDGDLPALWKPVGSAQPAGAAETAVDMINRVYRELYGAMEGVQGNPCEGVARDLGNGRVELALSRDCMARQIRAVITHERHGPWTEKGEKLTPQWAGTSSDKLPCLSEWSLEVEGITGDWDMAVTEHTRLAGLLYRTQHALSPSALADVGATLDRLNRRFLTLRSSPEQGATAREVFNLMTSCGNLPNQFGDALDTVHGNDADAGDDKYADAARDAVDDTSFWEDLLRFFAVVLLLVAVVLAAAIVGTIVGVLGSVLAGAGVIGAAVGAVVLVTGIVGLMGSIEETENHLLMQNSARYLKNKLMMAELRALDQRKAFDTVAELNEEVRTWLLERVQRIVEEDFVEYNSKPYNRYSHAALLNLLDFACDVSWDYEPPRLRDTATPCHAKDRAVVTAVAAMMDLSAAKLAVGSLEGRRLIPYRRLAEANAVYHNGRSLLELQAVADNLLGALQIWTGQMMHAPDGVASPRTFGQLIWYSTSQYRPDPLILDIAVRKEQGREQQYRHDARERYASGSGWLITAGGSDEGPAQGFRLPLGVTIYPPIQKSIVNDRGVGVPTTLMTRARFGNALPLTGRARVDQFLRFEGKLLDWGEDSGKPLWSFSNNNCVAGSFACGLGLKLPSDFDPATCRTRVLSPTFFIVDSTACAPFNALQESTRNDLFIAIFAGPKGWGFFEVAEQRAFGGSIDAYANAIKARNPGRLEQWPGLDADDTAEYFAVTQNRLLRFTPEDENFGADRRACGVVNHESGSRFTISNVDAVQAANCRSQGPRIFIDLDDAKNPIRRGEEGLALETYPR